MYWYTRISFLPDSSNEEFRGVGILIFSSTWSSSIAAREVETFKINLLISIGWLGKSKEPLRDGVAIEDVGVRNGDSRGDQMEMLCTDDETEETDEIKIGDAEDGIVI